MIAFAIGYGIFFFVPRWSSIHRLDQINMFGSLRGDCWFHFLDRRDTLVHPCDAAIAALENETLAHRINPRFARPSRTLPVSNGKDGVLIGAHAQHRGHAIGGVRIKVALYVLRGEVVSILVEADRIAQMYVKIHEARHDVLTG